MCSLLPPWLGVLSICCVWQAQTSLSADVRSLEEQEVSPGTNIWIETGKNKGMGKVEEARVRKLREVLQHLMHSWGWCWWTWCCEQVSAAAVSVQRPRARLWPQIRARSCCSTYHRQGPFNGDSPRGVGRRKGKRCWHCLRNLNWGRFHTCVTFGVFSLCR